MKTLYAIFNRFELALPEDCANDCSTPGQSADESVEYWETRVTRPEECTEEALARELKEYGAWDAEELEDDSANWRRIIWISACNIREEQHEKRRQNT